MRIGISQIIVLILIPQSSYCMVRYLLGSMSLSEPYLDEEMNGDISKTSGFFDNPFIGSKKFDKDLEDFYIPNSELERAEKWGKRGRIKDKIGLNQQQFDSYGQPKGNSGITFGGSGSWLIKYLPKVNLRCDPLINFKLKQRLVLLGACVTLGLDYLSDISQWRSYCAVEDTLVQGRFSLRGSELGWAKSWLINMGLGEENTAKFKLRLGLNLKSYKAYAKLRFRTEPISTFDLGDGLSCAGKLPIPVFLLPMLRSIPLRVEYRVRINTAQPFTGKKASSMKSNHYDRDQKVALSTGIDSVDLSLEELNFCLEWDEKSPVWDIGIVKSEPSRKSYMGTPFKMKSTSI